MEKFFFTLEIVSTGDIWPKCILLFSEIVTVRINW